MRRFIPSLIILSMLAFHIAKTETTARIQHPPGPYTDVRAIPAGPVGQRITELLDIINSGDRRRVRQYISTQFAPSFRDAFPTDQHLAIFAQVYEGSRGLDFYSVRHYQERRPDDEVTAIVRNRLTGAWQGIIIRVEPHPPHRIAGLNLAPARPPSDLPPPKKLSDHEVAREAAISMRGS